jgi:hypothetical protein
VQVHQPHEIEKQTCLLLIMIKVCFWFMTTFALCFTMGASMGADLPKMWGCTQLLTHPKLHYFGNAPTLGLYPTLMTQKGIQLDIELTRLDPIVEYDM